MRHRYTVTKPGAYLTWFCMAESAVDYALAMQAEVTADYSGDVDTVCDLQDGESILYHGWTITRRSEK